MRLAGSVLVVSTLAGAAFAAPTPTSSALVDVAATGNVLESGIAGVSASVGVDDLASVSLCLALGEPGCTPSTAIATATGTTSDTLSAAPTLTSSPLVDVAATGNVLESGIAGASASVGVADLASVSLCLALGEPGCTPSTAIATATGGTSATLIVPTTLVTSPLVAVAATGNVLDQSGLAEVPASVGVADLASVSLCLALGEPGCTPSTAIATTTATALATSVPALVTASVGLDGIATLSAAAGLGGVTATANVLGIAAVSICLGLGLPADCSAPTLTATSGTNPVVVVPTGASVVVASTPAVTSTSATATGDLLGVSLSLTAGQSGVAAAASVHALALASASLCLGLGLPANCANPTASTSGASPSAALPADASVGASADLTGFPAAGVSATVNAADLASASICLGLGLDAACSTTSVTSPTAVVPTRSVPDNSASNVASPLTSATGPIQTSILSGIDSSLPLASVTNSRVVSSILGAEPSSIIANDPSISSSLVSSNPAILTTSTLPPIITSLPTNSNPTVSIPGVRIVNPSSILSAVSSVQIPSLVSTVGVSPDAVDPSAIASPAIASSAQIPPTAVTPTPTSVSSALSSMSSSQSSAAASSSPSPLVGPPGARPVTGPGSFPTSASAAVGAGVSVSVDPAVSSSLVGAASLALADLSSAASSVDSAAVGLSSAAAAASSAISRASAAGISVNTDNPANAIPSALINSAVANVLGAASVTSAGPSLSRALASAVRAAIASRPTNSAAINGVLSAASITSAPGNVRSAIASAISEARVAASATASPASAGAPASGLNAASSLAAAAASIASIINGGSLGAVNTEAAAIASAIGSSVAAGRASSTPEPSVVSSFGSNGGASMFFCNAVITCQNSVVTMAAGQPTAVPRSTVTVTHIVKVTDSAAAILSVSGAAKESYPISPVVSVLAKVTGNKNDPMNVAVPIQTGAARAIAELVPVAF